MKVINVVGARPNFMKMAPIIEVMDRFPELDHVLIHTGQHYDRAMSDVFFEELGMPVPDIDLGIGTGSHAQQTAKIMLAFEQVLMAEHPDLVLVVGDVNSTLACALTAAKLRIPVGHVEAGLRSFDRAMPEELNRVVTDSLSDFLFTTSRSANDNLRNEGIADDKVYFVGNVMIDSLLKHRSVAEQLRTPSHYNLESGCYALLTLHRPGNVDDRVVLEGILKSVEVIQQQLPVLFPAHPRTMQRLRAFKLLSRLESMERVRISGPLGYQAFLDLMSHARLVLTDSGGIQEETTILKVPCLTLRDSTERPETVTDGSNRLVGTDPERIVAAAQDILAGSTQSARVPELWDGQAAQRIVDVIINHGHRIHAG